MAIDRQSLSGQADSLIATLDAVATARGWIPFATAVPALLLEIRITRGTCENVYDDVRCRVTKPLDVRWEWTTSNPITSVRQSASDKKFLRS